MDEEPKKTALGKKKLIRIAGSALSFAVLIYIAIALISGHQTGFFRVFGLFSGNEPATMSSEYFFDVGRSRVFADLNGSPASAGTLGIQVLDAWGNETLRDYFRMSSPMLYSQGNRAISYDIGGSSLRVFNNTEVLVSLETGGAIVSASINRNGWFAVCTQEGAVSKGLVTVYNNAGNVVYRVNLASGYVLSASLTPDNRGLAILNLTPDGSRVSFYELNSVNVTRVFELPGKLILDMRYMSGGDALLITEDSVIVVDKNNRSSELYAFEGRSLGGFSLYGDNIALYLLDYSVGYNGCVVSINEKGNILGEIETYTEIIAVSLGAKHLALLRSDGIMLFDASLEEIPLADGSVSSVGATRVLFFDNGRVLAAGDHSAVAFLFDK